MDTTNIIFHWIVHFRGQVTETETRPRPNAQVQGQMLEAKAKILH